MSYRWKSDVEPYSCIESVSDVVKNGRLMVPYWLK